MADDSSGGLLDNIDFGDLLNLASTLFGMHQAGKAPKFYIAPQTPAETWKSDALKNLFNYAGGVTDQYLKGISNLNPDFTMPNNKVGNPAFMGGIKVPTFDLSKLQAPSTGPSTPPTAPGKPTTGGTIGSGPTGVPGDPFGHITSPAGSPNDPFADQNNAPAGQSGGDNNSSDPSSLPWDTIKQLAGQYGKSIGEIATAFLTGNVLPLGLGIYHAYTAWKNSQNDDSSNETFGGPQDTQPNPFSGMSGDLQNGKPGRTPYDKNPTYQQQVGEQFINSQNQGMMNGPGQMPTDVGSGTPGFGYGWNYDSFYGPGGGRYAP